MQERENNIKSKRGYSAEGSLFLPSALRPRLGGVGAAIAILGGIYGGVSNVSAASNVTLTVPENITVEANPAIDNGFAVGTNSQVNVTNSNLSGYTLDIKAKDDTNGNTLVNENDEDSKLNSISETLTEDEYQNGKDGNNFTNTWAFKPDVVGNLVNTSYLPGPTTSGLLLANTNTNSLLGETFNLAIATKVDNAMPAGNYSNNFVLTATGNSYHYNISFNNNGGTGGPAGPLSGETGEDLEVQITVENPTLEGKDFLGWCTRKPDEDGSCPGMEVQPDGYFPLCQCNLDVTLWAMWGTKSSGGGSSGNGGSSTGSIAASDCSRPNYSGAAKYYGDYCWMWENYGDNIEWSNTYTTCPKGWRLPTKDDFDQLVTLFGNRDGLNYAGWDGTYWSSDADTRDGGQYNDYDFTLVVTSGNAQVKQDYDMKASYKIRCVSP